MEHGTGHACCCKGNSDKNKETAFDTNNELTKAFSKLKESDDKSANIWLVLILSMILFGNPNARDNSTPLKKIIADKLLYGMSEVNIRFK